MNLPAFFKIPLISLALIHIFFIQLKATVPFSEAIKSPQGNITLILHYEDATPIAQTRARVLEGLPAL